MVGVFHRDFIPGFPTAALIQFCASNIDQYTNYVGTTMFADLQLSTNGGRKLNAVLSNLPYRTTPDERLTFGWGPTNVVREPGVHSAGYDHLAVMMALASTFHEAYAAEVLHAYAVLFGNDEDVLPHMSQWRNQVRAFTGALAAGGFAQIVEEYIRLDPYSVGPGSNLKARKCRVKAAAMAEGLMALSRVVSKKEKQITMVGGAVIGWLAALAEWFYDLRVAIVSQNGEKVHGDLHDEHTQLILVYHQEPDLEVLKEHWSSVTEKASDDNPYWTKHTHFLPFGGRVLWQTLLPQVFGHAFWILDHEESSTLATIIGTSARCLAADHEANQVDTEGSSPETTPSESSYGIGLIQSITSWLPELRKGQGKMERQLKRTPPDAATTHEASISKLQKLCGCHVCSVEASAPPPREGYCLPVISEAIVALGLTTSRLTVDSGIYPTRQGVQGLYAHQAAQRQRVKHSDPKVADHRTLYAHEWRAGTSRRLQNAVELFAGTRPTDVPASLVALAHEGVCAYLVALRGASRDDPGLVQVTSGAVNVRQKIYTRVSTVQVEEDMLWEQVTFAHIAEPVYCK